MTPRELVPKKLGPAFDRYQIEALISRGEQASVFRARDLKLDRPVALKVTQGGDDTVPRFWREAELSSRLVHPNTVRVYDWGVAEQGYLFIAFEWLDGESLGRRVHRLGRLTGDETRRVARCLLNALSEAHALGIVHRDVKPQNVFLCRYAGEDDFVKLLDFGIAKQPERSLTAHGWLVGTPGFMPREQILGGRLGPPTDLYALGMVMATAMAGTPLIGGSTTEQLTAHCSDEPHALPDVVMQSPLYPVVRRAIEKEASARYQSAEEMLADLERVAAVAPSPAGPWEVAEQRPSREPCLSERAGAPSLAPVTSVMAHPSDGGRRAPALLAASATLLLLLVAGASVAALLILPRHARVPARSALAAHDPTWSPAWVRLRMPSAGLRILRERTAGPNVVDVSFVHPDMLGAVRTEWLPTVDAARAVRERNATDERVVTDQRGRRVLTIWAEARGQQVFERSTAERVFRLMLSGEPAPRAGGEASPPAAR